MMKKYAALLLLLLPLSAFAAGFAKDPLFLSRTPAIEGQPVRMYAVVSNPDTAAFVGSLIFYDGPARIGSNSINLAAGATQTASISWTPSAGSHAVHADLVGKDGTVAETISAAFSIEGKPKPASAPVATTTASAVPAVTTSQDIQAGIANVSPQVANATEPAFGAIDSARASVAGTLDSQISTTKHKLGTTPKLGIVEGAATQDVQVENPSTGVWYWLYTVYLYILEALRYLIGNAGVFYPFIAIAFLYFLWRLFRRYRRPAWQR